MVRKVLTYVGVFAAGALAVIGYVTWGGPGVSAPVTTPAPASTPSSVASNPAGESAITPIGDVARNTMVTVSGTVERITDEDEFIVADESGSITVSTGTQFFTVESGESVVVTGFVDDDLIIEIYAQEIEREDGSVVIVGDSSRSSNDAVDRSPASPSTADGAGYTPIGEVMRNTMVSVSGTVQRITDEDEFVVADASGSIPVWTGTQFFTVDEGETVVVTGFVDDDLQLEIYATEIVRADGSVVSIRGESDR